MKALGILAVVLGVSACGSSGVATAPGTTAGSNNGDSGTSGISGAGGSAPLDCGRFNVSVVVDGAIATACGQAILQHGVVWTCSAVTGVGTSSLDIGVGIPTTAGTYARPVAEGELSGDAELANEVAQVAITDADGATFHFDQQHGQGTMTVESASDQSATGTFDFSDDLGHRITGSMTVR